MIFKRSLTVRNQEVGRIRIFAKITLFFCLTLAVCLTVSSCAPERPSVSDKVIRVGLLPIDDSLPFFIAEQEGFFEKRGVSVELVTFNSASDKEAALEAGAIDGDMTDIIVAALLTKGDTGIKIVSIALGADKTEGRFMLLAAPGSSGISTIEDLRGVPVAVGNNTVIHYICEKLMFSAGFGEDEIKTQNIPDLGLRLEALLGSKIQAAILPDPLASLAVLQGAGIIADDTRADENLSQSVVLFSRSAIDSNEDEVQMVMDAYFEAMVFINENPDTAAVRNALFEFCRIPESMRNLYSTPSYTPRALPDALSLADVLEWMVNKGLLDTVISYNEMVDDRFANAQYR